MATIIYKCRCQSEEVRLEVPDREPGASINEWVDSTRDHITTDHFASNPDCTEDTAEYVKIPLDVVKGSVH